MNSFHTSLLSGYPASSCCRRRIGDWRFLHAPRSKGLIPGTWNHIWDCLCCRHACRGVSQHRLFLEAPQRSAAMVWKRFLWMTQTCAWKIRCLLFLDVQTTDPDSKQLSEWSARRATGSCILTHVSGTPLSWRTQEVMSRLCLLNHIAGACPSMSVSP